MTRFTCWMDGQGLHDMDPCLLITDMVESGPDMAAITAASARSEGLRVSRILRRSLTVTVSFVIRERSPIRRTALVDRVSAWAQGSVLTVGHRPDQQLRCLCTALPDPGSALKWYAPLTVQFTAFASPYWEAAQPATAWITPEATSGSGTLMIPGTVSAPVEAQVINQSGQTVNALTLACGETALTFTGLGLAHGEKLVIDYDEHRRLRMLIPGEAARSVMDKRTAASHDDLLAQPRQANAVAMTADQPVTVKFTARGRWL